MKLFISNILFLLVVVFSANAQSAADSNLVVIDSLQLKNDTLQVGKKKKPKEKHFQYYRIGIDISKLVRSALTDRYSTAEFLVESIWKKNMHYLVEGGYASSEKTGNISFNSSSTFLRVGFDKYFFGSLYKGDLDNAFAGARLGGAYHRRGETTAKLWDPYYGNTTVTKSAAGQLLYWLELTMGYRVELRKNIFLGWNIRGKTFVNPKKIQELTPEYLAGYGIARKQPSFDYNMYILYGFGKR